MSRPLAAACLLAILLGAAPPAAGPCTCDAARTVSGWCGACAVGYVAAVPVESEMLFEALDAHGHDIDPASIRCASCRAALTRDGFCPSCRWGFVDGQLYFSRLTWVLARGEPRDPAAVACPACRRHAAASRAAGEAAAKGADGPPEAREPGAGTDGRATAPPGWCDACSLGTVGHVAFADRADFEVAGREHARLLAAVRTSRRCAYCAVAIFTGGRCPTCPPPLEGPPAP